MKKVSSAFLLTTTANYLNMTQAMVNSLNHFHPDIPVILFVTEQDKNIDKFQSKYPNVEIRKYNPPALSFSDWHPLVWAKLEAFRLTDFDLVITLDVDQITYNPLDKHIQKVIESKRCFGAAPDDDTFSYQFTNNLNLPTQPERALNGGTLIIKPDKSVFEELLQLAERYHLSSRFPEQSILNLYAAKTDFWENLGFDLAVHPYSDKVLEFPQTATFIHFWTPRSPFFGVNPLRKGELTYSQAVAKFKQNYNTEYPEKRFERDFINRLNDTWPTESSKF